MNRNEIFESISKERDHQDQQWGSTFDDKNTPNDWVAYMATYLGKSVTFPFDKEAFRKATLKIAALAVAVLEREDYASTHYAELQHRPGA